MPTETPMILVVEDNPVLRELTARQINSLGYAVEFASNGKEAVDIAMNGNYGLILMDCQMHLMDGFEATMAIRNQERRNNRHVPIIALTASTLPSDMERCLAAGMDAYIRKPVVLKELEDVIETWLNVDREPAASQAAARSLEIHPSWIDRTKLKEIYGNQNIEAIVELLIEGAADLVDQVGEAVNQADDRLVSHLAHELKGLCGMMASERMETAAQDLEDAALACDPEMIGKRQQALHDTFSELLRVTSKKSTAGTAS